MLDYNFNYILIDDDLAEQFHSHELNFSQFLISVSSPANRQGKLVSRYQSTRNWTNSVYNKMILIPRNINSADLTISQNTIDKTITISVSKTSRLLLEANNLYQRPIIDFAACLTQDPHTPCEVWTLDASELITNDVTITYSCQDDVYIYTEKIFETYSHEQQN